jgi:hypothetical protein
LAPISLGVIRVIPNEQTGSRRLLAIHKPSEFEAHAEIEKGIPIVVSEEVYKRIGKSLQECGSAHVNEIVAIMSDVGDHSEYLKMIDMPYTFPLVEKENYITEGGDPVPIMGNGWVVYETADTSGFSHFRFWAGVDYHKKNLQEAKEALEKLIPGNGWVITNFDELVQHWKDAPLQLSRAWEYIRLLGKRKATIDKS